MEANTIKGLALLAALSAGFPAGAPPGCAGEGFRARYPAGMREQVGAAGAAAGGVMG